MANIIFELDGIGYVARKGKTVVATIKPTMQGWRVVWPDGHRALCETLAMAKIVVEDSVNGTAS